MKLSQFNFELPDEKIALYPAENRDECRMLVLHRKSGELEDRQFKDILTYFNANDVFVFNDTKVFPARLTGNKEKTGAKIEVFLLRELNPELRLWDVLVEPARKIRIGNKLYFGPDDSIVAEVIDNTTSRGRTLRFLFDGDHDDFTEQLYSLGSAPLPEFIKREVEPEDVERFQCVFAKHEGAVTAPATGMHFSKIMMKYLELYDIHAAYVTLHCGLGNFRETDVEDLSKHKIDSEQVIVTPECCDIVNAAKERGNHILAVGTTSQRALETAVGPDCHIKEYNGWTSKFIYPPYNFRVADCMLVNFYNPSSTLLMLTTAFGGYDNTMKAYEKALEGDYKFGPFGDCMLIMPD